MASSDPEILVRYGSNTGLVLTITISALLHVAVIALLIALPRRFLGATPPLESYTVDLVAPEVLGGTNLRPGKGGARPAAPRAPLRASAPASPAEERAEVAAVKPPMAAKPLPVEEPKRRVVEVPKPAPAPRQPPAPEKPRAEAAKVPPPAAKEASRPPAPPPAKEPAPKADAALKPGASAEKAPAETKPALVEESAQAPVEKKAAPDAAKAAEPKDVPKDAPKTATGSETARKDADRQIARAVAARAAQIGAEEVRATGSGSDVDDQIAAAVRRRIVEQIGAGGSEGTGTGDGGPISTGPGVGAGGQVRDLEYIAYRSQMEARIKEAWAWAGPDRSLVAVIGFNITPEGQIVNVRTVRSSGDRTYDLSAERAVEGANPLGPPPEKYRQEFWSVELEFRPDESRS